jgi:DNA-binding transcriptional LysR family regulator
MDRCGNITTAARQLGVQQPTLTVALQRLEAAVVSPLFLRDRSGVTLASTGRELWHDVTEALQLLALGVQPVQGLETEAVGSFTLGVTVALGSYFLPVFFAAFALACPRITRSLWTGTSPAVPQAVLTRDMDVGLAVNPTPHPELVLLQVFADATALFALAPAQDPTGHAPGTTERLTPDWETACARLRTGPLDEVADMPQAQTLWERLGAVQ